MRAAPGANFKAVVVRMVDRQILGGERAGLQDAAAVAVPLAVAVGDLQRAKRVGKEAGALVLAHSACMARHSGTHLHPHPIPPCTHTLPLRENKQKELRV